MNSLNDFVSINDIFRLGLPNSDETVAFPLQFFRFCFREKSEYYCWKDKILEFNYIRFDKKIPEFVENIGIEFSYLLKEDSDGKTYFCIDPIRYFLSLFTYYNRDKDRYDLDKLEEMRKHYRTLSHEELKLAIVQELKVIKNQYSNLISNIKDGNVKNHLIDARKEILWYIKNYDFLVDNFSLKIPDELFEEFDTDLFALLLSTEASNCSIKIIDGKVEHDYKAISYVEDYLLVCSYLEEKNSIQYNEVINIKGDGDSITDFSTDRIRIMLDEFYRINPELKTGNKTYSTCEDLFRNVLKDARRKVKKEDFVKHLELQWDILPKGSKDTIDNRITAIKKISDSSAISKDSSIILQQKIDYFSNLDYVGWLEGINSFFGYRGYILENGNVILEHFYKEVTRRKNGLIIKEKVPIKDESIYVMDIRDLADMSHLSKPEIIELIKSHKNKSIRRVYHRERWQETLNKIIENPYYQDTDLEEINDILVELAKRTSKIKK